jgi:hypothetical protein
MSINIKTVANEKHQQEIVMCSLIFQNGVAMDGPTAGAPSATFCAVRKLDKGAFFCCFLLFLLSCCFPLSASAA